MRYFTAILIDLTVLILFEEYWVSVVAFIIVIVVMLVIEQAVIRLCRSLA